MRLIVYLCISMIMGCLSSICGLNNIIIGAAVAAPFLAVLFFTFKHKKIWLCLGFFIIGLINIQIYFNFKIGSCASIRIIEKNNFYCIGNCKGRKVIIKGKILELKQGEKVIAYGAFKKNSNISKGIVGIYEINKYKKIKNDYIYNIYVIKNNLYKMFLKEIGEDNSALVMSICFGETQYLKNSQKLELQKLGVIHAVSVSGFHMAIIYKLLENILGLKSAICISFLYLLFTGMMPSTMRAFIMIAVLKLSKIFYRNYDGISSLCFAAMIILLYKPYCIGDLGFLLSFLSTIGIMLYYKKIQRILWFIPQKINENISLTLSAQCFSLPCIAFTIKSFSPGFILGNVFLAPIFSLIVILGNICFVFCKINSLFSLLNKMLLVLMNSLQGANYLLLKICPPMLNLEYIEGIIILTIYISYVFCKNNNYKFKYLPIYMIIVLLTVNFKVLPEIYYFNSNSINAVIIKQGFESVMICDYDILRGKDVLILKEKMKVNKVITNPEYERKINIDNNFSVNFEKKYTEDNNCIEVYFKKYKLEINKPKSRQNDIMKEYSCLYRFIFGKFFVFPNINNL